MRAAFAASTTRAPRAQRALRRPQRAEGAACITSPARPIGTARALTCGALALCLLVWMSAPARAHADSPLGELAAISDAYTDLPEVKEARRDGVISPTIAAFLLSGAPLDHKLAVIGALGTRPEPSTGSAALLAALARAHKRALSALTASDLRPDEAFVLALTVALEQDRGDLPLDLGAASLRARTPLSLLEEAAAAMPKSFTADYARALVSVQGLEDFCAVYKRAAEVNARFAADQRDMRPAAFAAIDAYIHSYADSCPDTPEGRAAELSTYNQVYRVMRVGPHILAATQGGVVIWDPAKPAAPVALAPARICTDAISRGGQAWIGCYDKLLHFDGEAFHVLTTGSADDAEGFQLLSIPGGDLIAYRDHSAWTIDDQAMTPLKAPLPEALAYHALARANGERWSIDFLNGLHTPKGFWPKGSPQYPGTDPRRLYEDAQGTLWIQDFERGAFRLAPDGASFSHQPGLDSHCAGVAPDPTRGRLWLLHYREGLRLIIDDAVSARIDLSALDYMRDLWLEPNGSLWVAGWGQLAHVTEQPDHTWSTTPFIVRSLPSP
jgi:hypothetical protein